MPFHDIPISELRNLFLDEHESEPVDELALWLDDMLSQPLDKLEGLGGEPTKLEDFGGGLPPEGPEEDFGGEPVRRVA